MNHIRGSAAAAAVVAVAVDAVAEFVSPQDTIMNETDKKLQIKET